MINELPILSIALSLLALVPGPQVWAAAGSRSQTPQILQERVRGRALVAAPSETRLELGNRTTGRITVQGWDQNVIEARAVSERGDEVLIVRQENVGSAKCVFLKADYANLDDPANDTQVLDGPPMGKTGPIVVHLEVNVPRHIELEPIRVIRSDVHISRVDTPVTVLGRASSVTLKDVGATEVHTRTGNVEIEKANGPVNVTSSSGAIRISKTKGDVTVNSIAGPVEITCLKGRANVSTAQGPIELVEVDGDVEAIAASSSIRLRGELRQDGRYILRSLSGRVEMMLPPSIKGFNATLISYSGLIESDFKLRGSSNIEPATNIEHPVTNRKVIGKYGNGSPQITLDSFEGLVKLSKVTGAPIAACK